MSRDGISVMIQNLAGNEDSVNAFLSSKGKIIKSIELQDISDGRLLFTFDDGTKMSISDEGRSCCEDRYMTTDDDLSSFSGSVLVDAEVREMPILEHKYDVHEMAFLVVTTSFGSFTIETHNVHNGYYGGFVMRCSIVND